MDLPLAIGIPVEYIPDQNLRLKLYRRLADLEYQNLDDQGVIMFISFESLH